MVNHYLWSFFVALHYQPDDQITFMTTCRRPSLSVCVARYSLENCRSRSEVERSLRSCIKFTTLVFPSCKACFNSNNQCIISIDDSVHSTYYNTTSRTCCTLHQFNIPCLRTPVSDFVHQELWPGHLTDRKARRTVYN